PALPANMLAKLCAIATPVAVVTASRQAPAWNPTFHLCFDTVLRDGNVPDGRVVEQADESTSAYVLFTSGSTGEPKGVTRPHRMNATRVHLEQGLYRLGESDRHLMKPVPFFREMFWGLATGGALVVARPGGERDDAYLVQLIRSQRITVCSFVPSM